MTVKELINELSKLNENTTILIRSLPTNIEQKDTCESIADVLGSFAGIEEYNSEEKFYVLCHSIY